MSKTHVPTTNIVVSLFSTILVVLKQINYTFCSLNQGLRFCSSYYGLQFTPFTRLQILHFIIKVLKCKSVQCLN